MGAFVYAVAAGGAGGPAEADTSYRLDPADSGSYTLDATAMAAVGGSALVGSGLGFEGAQAQIPASILGSITDSADGVDFVAVGAGYGIPLSAAASDAEAAGGWMKMGAITMDPRGQFDIITQVSFPTPATTNVNRSGLGIAMWIQSATAYQSIGQWWGWAAKNTTASVANARPYLSRGSAPSNIGALYDRVTTTSETANEFWLRWQRTADNDVQFSWKEDSADAWTIVDLGNAGSPMAFNGSSVRCGPGIGFGNNGTSRVVSFTADYLAVT